MTTYPEPRFNSDRYRSLGLLANPFSVEDDEAARRELGLSLEVSAAANRLVNAIAANAHGETSRPVLVTKTNEVPSFYHLKAVGEAERHIIRDDSLNIVHAYIQLFMMRRGRVRSTLSALGERLTFRSFEQTLAAYIEHVLAEPDESIASYHVLGPEGLEAFATRFREDPEGVAREYFGEPDVERRPELAEVADLRLTNLDVDAEETDASPELDSTVGDAPGTGVALPQQREEAAARQPVVDYIIEYTAKHLSPVIARCLRVYRERGLAAASMELRITKAPRKTLSAVVQLALVRFQRAAILYDGFDGWAAVPPEMRQSIVGTMTELRWMLDGQAVFVFLLEEGMVPELEEAFSAGTRVVWDFQWLAPLQQNPDLLDSAIVGSWLASASVEGAPPVTLEDPVLASLFSEAGGSLRAFAAMAGAAIEDAAERGMAALDDASLEVGRAALIEEAVQE